MQGKFPRQGESIQEKHNRTSVLNGRILNEGEEDTIVPPRMKLLLSFEDGDIIYMPPWFNDQAFGYQLPRDVVKLDPAEYVDEDYESGGCILTNVKTSKDEIIQHMKDMKQEYLYDTAIKFDFSRYPLL